jgi:cytochrome bd ubiquinol oxidase subunit I
VENIIVPDLIRRLTMAIIILVHVIFASFLIGMFTLGVTLEFFWVLNRRNPWFDRLAHGMARVSVYIYSFGAVLAIAFVLLIALFWPVFWTTLINVTFWPFALEGLTFVLTILFLFPWYYTWNSLRRFPAVHLSLGLALVLAAQWQQSMIDVVAGYMLTPVPAEEVLRVFLNPTAIPLNMHRVAGDLSLAGFLVAGYGSFRALRASTAEDRSYFDWVGHIGLIAGLGFLFIQPAIGLSYMIEIRAHAPLAFGILMRGHLSWVFLVQIALLSVLFFLSVLYMWFQVRKSGRRGTTIIRSMLILVGISAVLAVIPYKIGPSQNYLSVPLVIPLGAMQPWKYIALAGLSLGGIGAIVAYLGATRRGLSWGEMRRGGRQAQHILLALSITVVVMMVVMGYIRESARLPFLINFDQEMTVEQQQQFPPLPPPREPAQPGGG